MDKWINMFDVICIRQEKKTEAAKGCSLGLMLFYLPSALLSAIRKS